MCWSLSHRPRGEFSAILTIWFGSKLSIHHFQKQSLTIDLILSESMAGFVSELMVVFNRCGWSVWCLIHAVILVIANIYLFEDMRSSRIWKVANGGAEEHGLFGSKLLSIF